MFGSVNDFLSNTDWRVISDNQKGWVYFQIQLGYDSHG
jgi:hypothetical protein